MIIYQTSLGIMRLKNVYQKYKTFKEILKIL